MVAIKRAQKKGEKYMYISRANAMKQLHMGPRTFTKLCIWKGIFPRIPKSRSKAQGGNPKIRTLYYKSDINLLLHDPLLQVLRKEKTIRQKRKSARQTKDKQKMKRIYKVFPERKFDHLILEKYPNFRDALNDLDDALSTSFLFAAMRSVKKESTEPFILSRHLTIEFMYYVMATRSLTKVFVTIKGYYYRANIRGQEITWLVPHNMPIGIPASVNMEVMVSFAEFYVTFLGFVNFKLYQEIGVHYPPKLTAKPKFRKHAKWDEKQMIQLDMIEGLNSDLLKFKPEEEIWENEEKMESERMKKSKNTSELMRVWERQLERRKRRQRLFEDCKFFLGRETNRESLLFVIKSAGGKVSWDATCGPGHTYSEDDASITHQIVDRPNFKPTFKDITRYYIQPQWIYDCLNACILLPVQDYFIGVSLPPHLSPFTEEMDAEGAYKPPELQKLKKVRQALKKADETVDNRDVWGKQELKQESTLGEKLPSDAESEDEDVDESLPEEEEERTQNSNYKEPDVYWGSDDGDDDDENALDDDMHGMKKSKKRKQKQRLKSKENSDEGERRKNNRRNTSKHKLEVIDEEPEEIKDEHEGEGGVSEEEEEDPQEVKMRRAMDRMKASEGYEMVPKKSYLKRQREKKARLELNSRKALMHKKNRSIYFNMKRKEAKQHKRSDSLRQKRNIYEMAKHKYEAKQRMARTGQ